MPILFLLLIAVAVFVMMRRRTAEQSTVTVVPPPNRPIPPRHQRVTDTVLAERAIALKQAMSAGTITPDEAVDSLARTCGISSTAARGKLQLPDAG